MTGDFVPAAGKSCRPERTAMFPLIGSFLVSVIGHLAGKSIWDRLESSKASASATSAAGGPAPFQRALADAGRRFAEAPATTVSDVSVAPALPPATVGFASDSPVFSLDSIQAQ
jgi:hypothetical protein